MSIIEILEVNLPKEIKPYRMESRFVAWLPGGPIGDPTSYPDALREAVALGDEGCVGFITNTDEPAPVAIDWSQPLPSVLSRRKRK